MSFTITIKDREIYSFEDFGLVINEYPEECFKLINSIKFLRILKLEDPEKYEKVIELAKREKDFYPFIFEIQYIFNPFMELRYHGYSFDNLKDLGRKILSYGPLIDIYLKDFLKYKLLSKYMEFSGLKVSNPRTYDEVLKLEQEFVTNENKAYFKLGFLLAETEVIIYDNRPYADIKTFFEAMLSNYYLSRFSANFEKDQYVYAWIEVLGYGSGIDRYKNLVDTIEQQEAGVRDL